LLAEGSADAQEELFRRFYAGLYRFLLGHGHARQAIDAEDIAFLTFDAVKNDIEKFAWKSKLGTWIYAIAKNQATKFYSDKKQYETLYDYNNPNAVPYDETGTTREVHNVAKEDASLDFDRTGEGRWQYAEDSDEEAQKNASGPRSLGPSFQRCTRRNPEQEYLSEERRGKVKEYLNKMTKEEQEILKLRYFDGRRTSGEYRDGLTFREIGRKTLKSDNAVEIAHRRAIDELFVLMKFDPYFADRVIDPKPPSERKPKNQARQKATTQQPEEADPGLVP
jgi:RNA polymerase sigma factor (sigma-70 family)